MGDDFVKVVITGATSEIGIALIKSCISRGDEIMAIVREKSTNLNRIPSSPNIRLVYSDLSELEKAVVPNEKYDVFYHIGWMHTDKNGRLDPSLQSLNIKSSLSAVNLAEKFGCRTFVGAGSQAEYGIVEGTISSETHTNPSTAYGFVKLCSYGLTKILCEEKGIRHIWCRIFSVYGVNDNRKTLVNYIVDNLLDTKPMHFSKADKKWNYLYEDDAGEMMRLLCEPNVSPGVYCIANTQSMILREYILKILSMFNYDYDVSDCFDNDQEMAYGLQVDIQKTIDAINYRPQISFEEGVMRIIDDRKASIRNSIHQHGIE